MSVVTVLPSCQFECCGFNNATDWLNQNLGAVIGNDFSPPGCEACTIGGEVEDCTTFTYVNASLNLNFNFNVTGSVRVAYTVPVSVLMDHIPLGLW